LATLARISFISRSGAMYRHAALNLAPLTWLGYPRACIDYLSDLINVG